jgi:hypothetical protein
MTRTALIAAMAMTLAGCAGQPEEAPARAAAPDQAPDRFTIAPDDYHVPYAGTAEDGRRFFLSDELFGGRGGGSSYVGTHFVGIVPGDFIVYYAPWDGLDYDT